MPLNFTPYKKRNIAFVKIFSHKNWRIKYYKIETENTKIQPQSFDIAKQYLPRWLKQTAHYSLDTYNLATLILHQGKEGCFAIVFWFVDENMIQLHAYLASNQEPTYFKPFSDKGIVSCIWELEVIWHERKAWIKHVLKQAQSPNLRGYLNDCFGKKLSEKN